MSGIANTGGGGGGAAGNATGGAGTAGVGGSGVVVLRYLGNAKATGGTITSGTGTAAGYTLHTFTSTGTSAFTLTAPVSATLAGSISGTGGFTWNSGGRLTLSGTNSYSGGTVVAAGSIVGTTASLQGAITNNAAVEFAQAASGTYSGNMSGSGSLTKSGAGTLTLSGSNTFSGGATLGAGVLALGSADALGSFGPILFGGGTLQYTASNTTDYSNRFSNVAGQQYSIDTNGQDVTLGSNLTSSGGSFTKLGGGTLTLSGTNSYSGGTTVSAGRLVGTSASLQGAITNNAAVEFAQASSGTYSGSMSGSGSFTKTGAGSLTLAGTSSFTGPTRVEAGVLALGTGGSLAAASSLELVAGGTLNIAGRSQTFSAVSGTAGTIALGAGTLTVNASTASEFGGGITGLGSLVKQGAGTFTLSGTNSYGGGTTISAGRLIGTTDSLQGAITNNAAVEFAQTSAGTYSGNMSGTGSFTKSAAGNLILTGSSNYTGATTVSAGRLSVNGVLGNSPVMVLAAAELGGSGSIAGSLAILSGGTLAPGNSIDSLAGGATSFAAGSTFGYEVNSSLLGNLGTAADLLVVNGNLDIASGSLLTFTDITSGTVQPFVEDTTIFAMINYTGSWNNGLFTYGGNELADGERFFVGSQQWEIDYNYAYNTASPSTIRPLNFQADYLPSSGTQTFVAITAVPEPSTLVLLGIGSALACWAARRRRALPRTPHGVALPAQA